MSLWRRLKGEFIDIIEWLDDAAETMIYRFPHHDNEIKNGAQLVVREGQTALFVDEGELADTFPPGTYTLSTANLPILAKLRGWKYGFESPFKAEVYFVSTKQFTDRKWGTKNPIMLRDAEFGAVRLRAFGTYALRVGDPATFLRELTGTNARFSTDDITDQLRNLIVARFTDILGENKIPALDLAAQYNEMGDFLTAQIQPEFAEYGLELTKMLIENISLPPDVEAALDKRTSMGVIGDLNRYTQFQTAQAMEKAAENPGGGAAEGIGLGMGFAMANQMAQNFKADGQAASPDAPPPLPMFHMALDGKQAGPFDLDALKGYVESGQLTRQTLVWQSGMAEWIAAGEVPALAGLFAAVPPPLPPQ